jgi:hypothetical protein
MPMSPVQVQALVTAKVTALEQAQGLARRWQARFGCCQLRHMR